jgi:hypothetical protein
MGVPLAIDMAMYGPVVKIAAPILAAEIGDLFW